MIEPGVFLTDIVQHGVDFVEKRGRGYNNVVLLMELKRYIGEKYTITQENKGEKIVYENVDHFLLPVWVRVMFELNLGFDSFGTKFIPSVNFDIGYFVEEAYRETSEYWDGLRIEYSCGIVQE